jgi:hypothetical protein
MKRKLTQLMRSPAFLSGAVTLVVVGIAKASLARPPAPIATNINNLDTSLFCPIINGMFGILISVAVIMVLWAAYNYLTAGDDTEKVHRATKTMTYAAIAVAVAIIAEGFPLLVGSIFNQGSGWSTCAGGSSSSASTFTPVGNEY